MTITATSIANTWGSTPIERTLPFPCDEYLPNPEGVYFRAVTVQAPAHVVYEWLCQLRVAPYSYDWIDNFGRQSPRSLTPGLENLEIGQRVMTIFKLVDFEPDRHLTITLSSPQSIEIFGEIAASYVILPQTEQSCRLVAKLLICYPHGSFWSWMRWFLPWGDLFMMRKQLLNLKNLAENQIK